MSDPVTTSGNQRPAARISGVQPITDPTPTPATTRAATLSPPVASIPVLLPPTVRSMLPGVPMSVNEAKAMLPDPSVTVNSKNTSGVPVGLEIFAKYSPSTNSGISWISYQKTVETPYVTLVSDVFIVNRFDGKGTKGGASFEAASKGPIDFRGAVTYEGIIGKENKIAATALVGDLLKIDYSKETGFRFGAAKSFTIPLGDEKTGPVLSFDLNMSSDKNGKHVTGGASLGIKK